jgi:hypothetical protein
MLLFFKLLQICTRKTTFCMTAKTFYNMLYENTHRAQLVVLAMQLPLPKIVESWGYRKPIVRIQSLLGHPIEGRGNLHT